MAEKTKKPPNLQEQWYQTQTRKSESGLPSQSFEDWMTGVESVEEPAPAPSIDPEALSSQVSAERRRGALYPLLGLLETIASRGKQTGADFLWAGQIETAQERAQRKLEQGALQRRISEAQLAETERKLSRETEFEEAVKRRLGEEGLDESTITELYCQYYPVECAKQQIGLENILTRLMGSQQLSDVYAQEREKRAEERRLETEQRGEEYKMGAEARGEQRQIEREERAEQRKIEAEQRKEAEKMKGVSKMVNTLADMGDKVPAEGRLGGVWEKITAAIGKNPDVKVYQDMAEATLGNLQKQFGGEAGRLSDQDIARARRMTYSVYDTPKERKRKKAFWKAMSDPSLSPEQISDTINSAYDDTIHSFPNDAAVEATAANEGWSVRKKVVINGRPMFWIPRSGAQ